jgi:hypothetical protein
VGDSDGVLAQADLSLAERLPEELARLRDRTADGNWRPSGCRVGSGPVVGGGDMSCVTRNV